jgi:hypothetical protein
MVTDPATTPESPRNQRIFGAAVALTYGLVMMAHVVFGLFFALVIVTGVRGVGLTLLAWRRRRAANAMPALAVPTYAE